MVDATSVRLFRKHSTATVRSLLDKALATVHGSSRVDGDGILNDDAHRKHNAGLRGHFALQLHTSDELLIQFRNIRVRRLD